MELTLESGRVIRDVTEADILAHVEGEEFAILAVDEETYRSSTGTARATATSRRPTGG